jgi:hypothetical protein
MADAAESVAIRHHLQQLLSSEQMEKSEASQKLLRYLAERALRGETPKETEIAIDVFGRDASFNSAEESLVRVAVRALRRRLHDYYTGPGQHDEVRFDIPKGGYRLTCVPREVAPVQDEAPAVSAPESAPSATAASLPAAEPALEKSSRSTCLRTWAVAATVLLVVSVGINSYLWLNRTNPPVDPEMAEIARSPLWSGIVDSDRPVMLVVGDSFMYTQVDPLTGRVQFVRDRAINSSEELRIFLAANPSIAEGKGQRYTSMVQKSTTIGMTSVLRLLTRPGRQVEVRARDDLQVDDLQKYDIVYIGPLSRLGPLAGHYELQSRYRYEQETGGIRDIVTGKSFVPEGETTVKHTEYALAARFVGPGGNRIVILTPGGRNSGMLLTVRMATSQKGLQELEKRLLAFSGGRLPDSFEALLSVTSFGQTDVAAEMIDVHALPHTLNSSTGATNSSNAR